MAATASSAYFSRIDNANAARHFTARLKVYFDGKDQAATTFTAAAIQNYKLTRELAAEDRFPLGKISNSSLIVNLDNTQKYFTASNTDSPYFGKLKQGTKVELYTSLLLASGSYEEIKMCTMYSGEWDAANDAVFANLICYDRLYFLRQKKTPKIPVFINTTISALFSYLFMSLGLAANEYSIDSALDYDIPYGWIAGATVDEALQQLALAGMCVVYVDRDDRIIVTVPYKRIVAGRILSSDTAENFQIKTLSHIQAAYKAYTGVNVNYYNYTPQDNTLLATITQNLEANLNEFEDIAFNTVPAVKVDCVRMQNTVLDIAAMSIGAQSLNISINSTVAVETVAIDIYGRTLIGTPQTVKFAVTDEASYDQPKRLEIESVLVQSRESAKKYGSTLNQIVTDPNAYMTATMRGDLTFDLCDVYVLKDTAHGLAETPVFFTRVVLDYSGALSCEVSCTKYDSLAIYDYAAIAPGFFVKKLRTI